MLEVSGLAKSFGKQVAVDGLSFRVEAGEVVGLVGANGAGKTTTLLAVAGVLRPDAGTVRIGGVDLAARPVEAKRMLGFVPDEPALFDYLSVEEHLRFMGRLYRVGDIEKRLPALLFEMELGDRRTSMPTSCRGNAAEARARLRVRPRPESAAAGRTAHGLDPVASGE